APLFWDRYSCICRAHTAGILQSVSSRNEPLPFGMLHPHIYELGLFLVEFSAETPGMAGHQKFQELFDHLLPCPRIEPSVGFYFFHIIYEGLVLLKKRCDFLLEVEFIPLLRLLIPCIHFIKQ